VIVTALEGAMTIKGEPTFIHVYRHPTCQRCSSACRDVDVARVKRTFGFDEVLYPRGGLR